MKDTAVVVLAAGKGKRMHSDTAKVLHEILGRPMVEYLLDTLKTLNFTRTIIIIGHQANRVRQRLSSYGRDLEFVLQDQQLGTGHAVMVAEKTLAGLEGNILVVAGDVPFLSARTISELILVHERERAAATVLSSIPPDPTGYGRIVRIPKTNLVDRIVEHKEAGPDELAIVEINTGTFCFDSRHLFSALKEIKDDNAQKEYYLTDVMAILRQKQLKTAVHMTDDSDEALGVNSAEQKAQLEAKFAHRRTKE